MHMTLSKNDNNNKKEVANIKGSIDDGFKRIEGWIVTIVRFGVGTVIFGLGLLAYKVIVYDVSTNNDMKAYIDKAITTSEQRTEKATKAGLDNLKLAMELSTQRQRSC